MGYCQTLTDIIARLEKASAAYSKLDKIWKNNQFTYKTEIKIFKSNVILVLLYGCECWPMTKNRQEKMDAFRHQGSSTWEPSSDIKDLLANAYNERGD